MHYDDPPGPSGTRLSALLGALAVALLSVALACGGDAKRSEKEAAGAGRAAGKPAARSGLTAGGAGLGRGFVAWESLRTGDWRIWAVDLDGANLRQLSADEAGRNHCCAHVSPDGVWVTYLSFEGSGQEDEDSSLTGALHLVRPDGGGDRVVVPQARTYRGKRAAVWSGDEELIYIDDAGYTVQRNLGGGEGERLTGEPARHNGWLINPARTHAVVGFPTHISPYDAARRRVIPSAALGGCEPYFTLDGRWAFWVAGAGGPINRFDLASGEIATILRKYDSRLPGNWGYMYFPMTSPDGRMLAWGASRGEHDHFKANYEIFVAPIDPDTLELIGAPVRMTGNPAPDRFPTVFLQPLPLGRHRGEAPFTVQLEAPEEGSWSFELGDGQRRQGRRVEHTYRRPGAYEVVARADGRSVTGQVVVEPAAPPRPLTALLQADARTVRVALSEPVRLARLTARLESGREVADVELDESGRTLSVRLAQPLEGFDRLHLSGLQDRSQVPNVLPSATLPIEPPSWPADPQGVILLWQTGDAPNLVQDPDAGADRAITVEAEDGAHLDNAWRMVLGTGAFRLPDELSTRVGREIQGRNELSLELVVTPAAPVDRFAPIVSTAGRTPNFQLGQRGDRLIAVIRIGPRGREAFGELELMRLPVGETSHVALTYTPGRLVAYRDGEVVVDSDAIQGDFYHWESQPWIFGGGDPAWRGTVEGVALYDRLMTAEEVAESARRYQSLLAERPAVPRAQVEARVTGRSRIPTLEQINPYREGLVVYEYRVERIHSGEAPARIRVAHWAILDGETQPVARRRDGERVRLTLEPFAANEQLTPYYVSDTLGDGDGEPLFYSVGDSP